MKKNIKLKRFLLTLCLGSFGLTSLAQALPVIQNEYLLDKLSTQKEMLRRYETDFSLKTNEEKAKEKVEKLKDYLNIDSENVEVGKDGKIVVKGEKANAFIEFNPHSNSFLYKADMTKYNVEQDTPYLLSQKEALEMAYKHLESLNFLPKESELGRVDYSGLNMSVKQEDGKVKDYRKTTSVRLNRVLEGLPVIGNSRIFINMGIEGEITNMVYKWSPIKKAIEMNSKEIEDASLLKDEIYERLETRAKDAEKVVLNEINLVMYDNGKGLIEPVYQVVTQLFYADGKESYDVLFDFLVPVMKKPQIVYPFMTNASAQPIKGDDKILDTPIEAD